MLGTQLTSIYLDELPSPSRKTLIIERFQLTSHGWPWLQIAMAENPTASGGVNFGAQEPHPIFAEMA